MIELSRATISEERDFVLDKNTTLYPFSLTTLKKTTTIYAIKKTEQEQWVQSIKNAIGHSNIYSIYNIQVNIYENFELGMLGKRWFRRGKDGKTSRNWEKSCFENI